MSETLYPIFYGTRLVPFSVLRDTFRPRMHPEFWRRLENFILSKNGFVGIGGGWRGKGQQPKKTGFAPEGKSFHQYQEFPSGIFYTAVDLVVVNPGGKHRAPQWKDVPKQTSLDASLYGVHANVASESWHLQPIELDGWETWVIGGRKDLVINRPLGVGPVAPVVVHPPTPNPSKQPQTRGITVEFTSRVLVEGSVGPDVRFWQGLLNDYAGQGLLLDQYFGPRTTQAVRNWQNFFGLAADGVLGPVTQRSIIEVALQAS